MGVSRVARSRLARWAAQRPHVLLVTAPGGTAQRLAVEAHVWAVGGVLAPVPADTDLLVVAGTPSPQLVEAVDRVWAQVPAPRVRVHVGDPATAAVSVDAGVRDLVECPDANIGRYGDGHHRDGEDPAQEHRDHDASHGTDAGHEHGPHGDRQAGGDQPVHDDHAGHGGGHAGVHDGGHGGHGGHEGMPMPGGLMMADRAPDRDGLTLDVLQVPLGPVLPAWPAGLVVDTRVQGDLVQAATARVLSASGAAEPGFWAGPGPARRAAAHLDSVARLLAVAGWTGAAAQARRQRDQLLATPDALTDGDRRVFARWRRRLERSWGLRRSLTGVGRLTAEDVDRLGLSGPAARATARGGDGWARLSTWLAETDAALHGRVIAAGESSRGAPGQGSSALLAAAVELMPGLDLADARLVMAGLDPDTDEMPAI